MKRCVYCDSVLKRIKRGEHCFPDALGTSTTIKCVCALCNQHFSALDEELVSRSPLKALVQQEIGSRGHHIWNYDHDLDLALEAHVLPKYLASPLWPQLVLYGNSRSGVHFSFREDLEDGVSTFLRAFRKCLKYARNSIYSTKKKKRCFRWEAIRCPPDRGQFPPRVYCQRHYPEFKLGMTFSCRHLVGEERGRILYWLDRWLSVDQKMTVETAFGVADPENYSCVQPDALLKAGTKIALNCLAYNYGQDRININTFTDAIAFCRWNRGAIPSLVGTGFIRGHYLKSIDCPDNYHTIRINRINQVYVADIVLFGGKAGLTVIFPGPPLGFEWFQMSVPYLIEGQVLCSSSKICIPRRIVNTWDDVKSAFPTLPITNPRVTTVFTDKG